MNYDDALRELATTGNELPRAAMRWSLDHWDEAGPRFVALLDAYASGADRSETAERALFFALHLMAEKREQAAFAPLCRMLLDREAADLILGDAITSTLHGILISTYGDDPAPLKAVIEAEAADDYVRHSALLAMAYLTRTGRVPEREMRSYLLHLLMEAKPQRESFVWVGWVEAVINLGWADMAPQAEDLCKRGFVAAEWMGPEHVRKDIRRTLDDPDRMAGFVQDGVAPFTDAIGTLSGWHAFSGKDDGAAPAERGLGGLGGYQQPITNPLRAVGRNDPCPCGSGRKYKKCCLA